MVTTRWSDGSDAGTGERYAARFDALAASGADVHGEATLCELLAPAGGSVLDAGCGTGRVAIRLAERGFACAGVDVDQAMLDVARRRAPQLRWLRADLVDLDLDEDFDLVVAAGNVVPLVAEGTEDRVVARMAAHVRPGGLLVAGFGLAPSQLPPTAGVVALADYDAWCDAAGLLLEQRFATWEREPYTGGDYAVSAHRRPTAAGS
jgi:SAM-dependent methyltransferase